MAERTDTERLDFLQDKLGRYTGWVVCRWSTSGRGWRLHESDLPEAEPDVRKAIDRFIAENQ